MVNRILKRTLMGFVIGMPVGTLILIFISYTTEGGALLFTPALLERMGNEATALLAQTLLSGVVGAVGMGSACFFDLDGWSVPAAAVAHWAVYTLVFLPIGFFLGWLEGPVDVLVMAVIFAVVFPVVPPANRCASTKRQSIPSCRRK
jgi:hypothetical protein